VIRYAGGMSTSRAGWPTVAVYAAVLLAVNFYICRELLWTPLGFTNSMHGFWMAISERSDGSWLHPSWWPFWDCGIPFEYTYAPLLPMVMTLLSSGLHVSPDRAFQIVTAIVYCFGPLTLFLAAYLFSRSASASFLAALAYSLTSPSQLLVPDADGSVNSVWSARRLVVMTVWDDTPHLLALMLLPLAIVALYLALTRKHPDYQIAAIVLSALTTYASVFGAVFLAIVTIPLLIAFPGEDRFGRVRSVLFIGAFSYALAASFLPPSLVRTIRNASSATGSVPWLAIILTLAAVTLFWYYLKRWTEDGALRFLALLTILIISVPLIDFYFHHQMLPQPERYKLEMDALLPVLVVFSLRSWFLSLPFGVRGVLLLAFFAVALSQIITHRAVAEYILRPTDLNRTVEARASIWLAQNMTGVRAMIPKSLAAWADAFAEIPQFTGSSWSMAYNQVLQRGAQAQFGASDSKEQDAKISLAWLKAFGVGVVGVSGAQSAEFWKGYKYSDKFDGVLPVLWQSDGVTLYQVSLTKPSLAHIIPKSALVRKSPMGPDDIAPMELYLAALDDPALSLSALTWEGRNRIFVHTTSIPGQVLSLQITFHKGWHAMANGRPVRVQRDALNLLWLDPGCDGACEVILEYDGGWELRIARYLSVTALLALIWWAVRTAFKGHPPHRGVEL
jgi:hypothetical protein